MASMGGAEPILRLTCLSQSNGVPIRKGGRGLEQGSATAGPCERSGGEDLRRPQVNQHWQSFGLTHASDLITRIMFAGKPQTSSGTFTV